MKVALLQPQLHPSYLVNSSPSECFVPPGSLGAGLGGRLSALGGGEGGAMFSSGECYCLFLDVFNAATICVIVLLYIIVAYYTIVCNS